MVKKQSTNSPGIKEVKRRTKKVPLSFDNRPPAPPPIEPSLREPINLSGNSGARVMAPQLRALGVPEKSTPVSAAFRSIQPHWRNYLEYVRLAAKNGDEDMNKVVDVFNALPKKEQRSIMPEKLCDLAGVQPHELISSVCGEIWRTKSNESSMVAAIAHPQVMDKIAEYAQTPFGYDHAELFMRATGSLPDKKGISVVVNNSQQNANMPASGQGPSGFMSMDQDVIEMDKRLELPEAVPAFFKQQGEQDE